MKILLANKYFFLKGGAERVFFQERDFLLGSGYSVVDFSMEDTDNRPSPFKKYFVSSKNYRNDSSLGEKIRLAASFVHSAEAVHNLKKLLEIEKPQVAHLHNIYHQITPSIIPVLKEHGVKVVVTLHDGKLVCPSYLMLNKGQPCLACRGRHFYHAVSKNCQNSLGKCLLLAVEAYWHALRKTYEAVDCFIAPSRFMAELMSQYRIREDRIQVIRNGIELDEYQPTYVDKRYLLFLGRLSGEKGLTTLAKAHGLLRESVTLKIAGTGPLEKEIKTQGGAIELLGHRSGEELRTLIREASAVIVPSECYENCPMAVLEAMAMGKPVIASFLGGLPEQIEDGQTGLLFEPGNERDLAGKIETLMCDDQLRLKMGRAARIRLEQEYSLQSHCQSILSLYRSLSST